jgi:hypothetical protein
LSRASPTSDNSPTRGKGSDRDRASTGAFDPSNGARSTVSPVPPSMQPRCAVTASAHGDECLEPETHIPVVQLLNDTKLALLSAMGEPKSCLIE